jgi:hypothetical protein
MHYGLFRKGTESVSTLHRAICLLVGIAAFACASAPQVPVLAQSTAACAGDCNGNGTVTVDELLTLANVALGTASPSACAASGMAGQSQITVEDVVAGAKSALQGCPLVAAVHFDRPLEAINEQLIGSVAAAPLADDNELLRMLVSPPYMRLDVGFEDSGCPDNPDAGPLYDATSNTFDYCQLDNRIEKGAATGARSLLIIDYTPPALAEPTCAASNGHGLGAQHCPPADYTKYGALVEAMIEHVCSVYGVTDFEVWNEPDGLYFAGTLADYLQIYDTCNAAMTRAEQALGLDAGTLHLGGPAAYGTNRKWINGLLGHAVTDPALRVDFISWHIYANNVFVRPPDPALYAGVYADATAQVRAAITPFLAQRPDLHPLLWIDEWNVNAAYDARMDTAYDAAFMVASLHGMQDAALDRAARFNTWDSTPANPQGSPNGNWGLFTNDGQVRPALYGFAFWRQMAPTRVAVEPLDAASQSRDASTRTRYAQNLIASVDTASGEATVLLYNFVPYSPLDAQPPYCGGGVALDATLQLRGLAAGTYALLEQQIDCTTPIQPVAAASLPSTQGMVTVTSQGVDLSLRVPADGAVLLQLTPMP